VRLAATALITLAALTATSVAEAAQRYASPGAVGEVCSKEVPCSLKQAITKAKAGDEVIVNPGTYTESSGLQTPAGVENINIHGAAGGTMPVIVASASLEYTLEFKGAGGRLSYLAVEDTAPTFPRSVLCEKGGLVERVVVSATGEKAIGISQIEDCTVRDSLVLASGTQSQAFLATGSAPAASGVSRNVTAIAHGSGSKGITASFSYAGVPGRYTLNARNLIVSGDAFDLATAGGAFGVGHFQISNSNFETTKLEPGSTVEGSANQTAAALFVDAAKGDYHEAAGSPTIDAGADDGLLGALDLGGGRRVLGTAPDIGAYEFPSPPAAPAAQIQSLKLAPKTFRAAPKGSAIIGRKKKAPVGTTVTYSLSAAGSVQFTVERKTVGRKGKGKCVKKTRANAAKKHCALFKPVKGSFSATGVAAQNRFTFSGRVGNRPLKPGAYRLTGSAGGVVKRASFRVVK
jgi:hypothetical protein